MKKKKVLILCIIGIISIVLILVRVTYAFFNYVREGTLENTITTGTITFLYTEVDKIGKGISIHDAFPISDDIGKIQTGDGRVFNFKITSTTTKNVSIPYEITARKNSESTLDEKAIRMYLTQVNEVEEKQLLLENYNKLPQTEKVDSTKYIEKTLYIGQVPANQKNYEQEYRLRMWIDEKTDFSQDEEENYSYNDKTFTITVNVYANGKVVTQEEQTNPLNKKILYAPFDDIGETIPKKMLLYAPFDGVGYVNENYQQEDVFINKADNKEFTIVSGDIASSKTKTKVGKRTAYFSGKANQRLNANIPELNLGTEDFTISLWVNPEKQEQVYPVLFSEDDNKAFMLILSDKSYSGRISLLIGGTRVIVADHAYRQNEWTHYAVVRKDGIFTLYENGKSIGSTDKFLTSNIDISNFSIGGNSSKGNYSSDYTAYKGYMDDFAIYNYAKWWNDFEPPITSQEDANLVYLDFEQPMYDNIVYTQEPLQENIYGNSFNVLGNTNIEGRNNEYKFGESSLYFPGTKDQRLNLNIPELNLGTEDFTISLWVNPEEQEQVYPVLFSEDDNKAFMLILSDKNYSGRISLLIGGTRVIVADHVYKQNEWTHYAVVRKDGIFTLYENGKSIGSTDKFLTSNINISNFSIGGNSSKGNSSGNYTAYKGYMDDFAIYNYAKYTNEFTPPNIVASSDYNEETKQLHIKECVTDNEFSTLGKAKLIGTNQEKKFGESSLYFPGTKDQRINLNVPELNLGTEDFTISLWVNPEEQEQAYPVLFSDDDNNNFMFILSDKSYSGRISLLVGTTRAIIADHTYSQNEWTHYAVVRKDGIFALYENGKSIGSTDKFLTSNINISNFSIGGNSSKGNSSGNYTAYKGYMDDFVIYNYAKYTNEFTPPTIPAGNLE